MDIYCGIVGWWCFCGFVVWDIIGIDILNDKILDNENKINIDCFFNFGWNYFFKCLKRYCGGFLAVFRMVLFRRIFGLFFVF